MESGGWKPFMTSEEVLLSRYIEAQVGGRVMSIERQARWRKAWFVKVEREGQVVPLYVRGDKQLDAEPYPGLPREAAILQALEVGGIAVSHVYGVCPEPIGIVMDQAAGGRDVSQAASDDERRHIAEQYVEQLARIHALDTAPFVAAGITLPADGRANVLAYLDANLPLYLRGKRQPQPLIEFVMRWARRCAPVHRSRSSFIVADTGQFLFADGQLTCIHDFEASHIGDPLADLASLRTRDGYEPIGADISHLIRHYARVTGEAIDPWVLSYHTAVFSLTSVMALSGPLSEPDAHRLQTEYLVWNLMTRRATLWAMAECLGITLTPSPAPPALPGRQAVLFKVLEQSVARLPAESDMDRSQREGAVALARWAAQVDASGAAAAERERRSLGQFLPSVPEAWSEADAAFEQFVQQAGPEHDEALLRHFAMQLEDQIAIATPLHERLAGYALKPVVL
jgi:aminoglycoside phosphotransferase (APT) family kinase protein